MYSITTEDQHKTTSVHIMLKHTDIELFFISSKIGLGNWYLVHLSATPYIT